jgi:3-phosphoshikimate 1-carboxyvinyltransferase
MQLMEPVIIEQKNTILKGEINLTGSKVISNRLLLISALSYSDVEFKNLSQSEDTEILNFYLNYFNTCASSKIAMIVDLNDAVSIMHFVIAFATTKEGKWLITGHERLKKHSVSHLVNSLRSLGSEITYTEKDGSPPVKITGNTLNGDKIYIDSQQNSNSISALMLIAPYIPSGLTIILKDSPVSGSYINLTATLMKQAGIDVFIEDRMIKIGTGDYNIDTTNIESDWNNAAFWYEMVALSKDSEIFIHNLQKNSIQAERALADIYSHLGVQTIFYDKGIMLKKISIKNNLFKYDFKNFPDLAPSVIVTCAALGIKAAFTGINIHHPKENERIKILKSELKKIGISIERVNKTHFINTAGTINKDELELDAFNSHKIALSFTPLALIIKKIKIYNPGMIRKSYPNFWKEIRNYGLDVRIPEDICS